MVGNRQAGADARLQDAVAGTDATQHGVIDRAIKRMRHGADELLCGFARQLRVGIQRDDIFHAGQNAGVADQQRKRIGLAGAQQGIQVRQLAALALVAHPDAVMRIPPARAV